MSLSLNLGLGLTSVKGVGGRNLADPAVTDPSLANTAAQLHRLWVSGSGALSAASPTTLGTFAVTRRYPVVAGRTYTIHLLAANEPWFFYFPSAFISQFNGSYVWQSNITDFTRSNGDRVVTFTPTITGYVAFNLRNLTDFSNDAPATAEDLQGCVNAIMLTPGQTARTYRPFGGLVITGGGLVQLVRRGAYTYVRAALGPATDVVWRTRTGGAVGYGQTGTLDFRGERIVPAGGGDTVEAFNASTSILSNGTDEGAPVKLNTMYLAAGHGIIGQVLTRAAHGMTNVDVGSTWTDGAAKVWVLVKIVSATQCFFIADNTGTSDKWVISTNAPTGLTLTHQAGATHTSDYVFTVATQGQLMPILRGLTVAVSADGSPVAAEANMRCDAPAITESWTLINPASLLTYLKANVGSASAPDYTNVAVDGQISMAQTYSWNRWGVRTCERVETALQAYKRAAGSPGDYSGGIQQQPILGTTIHEYVPDIAAVSGYDFQAVANITANNSFIALPAASCANPSDPASHFAMIARDGGGADIAAMVWGYNRTVGMGVPATRAAAVSNVGFFSTAEKQYPVAVDVAAGDEVAATERTIVAFKGYVLPVAGLTVPPAVHSYGGKDYAVLASHVSGSGDVPFPSGLEGKNVTVLKNTGASGIGAAITSTGLAMTRAAYTDVVLELAA